MDNISAVLDVTGEVISPDYENITTPLFMRHMAAYRYFMYMVKGRKVLEIGFGEGYGTDYLASEAAEITGMDPSQDLVDHARAKYVRNNGIWFIRGDATDIPFADNRFEVVLSSQVLERIKDYPKFLRETRRVLSGEGAAIFATPNRKTMIDGVNPYHYKEFSHKEFNKALCKVFSNVEVVGLFGSERYMALKAAEHVYAKKMLMLDFLRLRRFVPRFVLKPVYKRMFESVNRRTERDASSAGDNITMDDFSFGTSDLDRALDLIGICKG